MKDRTVGILIGLGGGIVAAALYSRVGASLLASARPFTKELIKQTLNGVDRLRIEAAKASEVLEDIVAEVRAESAAEQQPRATGPKIVS